MPLLLSMSVTGGIAMLFYLFAEPLMKRFLPLIWRRLCLAIVAVFYLYPFAYLCNRYRIWLVRIFRLEERRRTVMLEDIPMFDTTSDYIQISEDGIYNKYLWLYIVLILALCVGLILFGRQIYRYCRMYHFWRKQDMRECCVGRRRLRIVKRDGVTSPFVIGFFRSIIVFPVTEYTEEEETWILQHERRHVTQYDNLCKIFIGLILFVHFYNPMAYVLAYKWSQVSEMLCDKSVIRKREQGVVVKYGTLLLQTARKQDAQMIAPVSGLNVHYRMTKSRICELKRTPPNHYWLGPVVVTLILLASLSIVLYKPREIVRTEGYTEFSRINEESFRLILETHLKMDADVELIEIGDKNYYVKKGTEKINCENHFMQDCDITNHIPTPEGGCMSETWSGSYCCTCNRIEKRELQRECEWFVCDYFFGECVR